MKNTFKLLAFIVFFALISCNDSSKQVEQNIDLYSSVWDDIINKGEIDKINSTNFTEDITMVASPENVTGIDNFKAYYNQFLVGFSEIKFTIIDVFGQGDKLVKHWRFEGKHTGDFMGISPTGRIVNLEGTTLVQMKDGRIAQEQDFMDNMVFLQQLGIVSDPNNMNVVNTAYNAFAAGDVPGVLATFDEKIVWNEAEGNEYADQNPYIGPEAVANGVFGRVVSDWDGFKLVGIELHEMSNNQVLATLRYNGTNKKTKKSIDAQVAHLWTLKDGKIVGFQQYVDTKQLADASGN